MLKTWNKIVFIIVAFVFLIRLFFLHPTFSDENFYFNVAKQILAGSLPYKDFFFSHPPLQIYTLASLFKVFGTSIFVGKLLPLITSSLNIILVFLISKSFFDEKTGFLASVFYIIFPAFLSFSLIEYGMLPTVFFFLLSFYLLIKDKPLLSASSLAIACMFRYNAIFYLPLFLMFYKKKEIKKFFIYFLIVFSAVLLLFTQIFGHNFINDTIIFHTESKVSVTQPFTMQYWSFNLPILFLVLISIILGITKKDKILVYLSIIPLVIDLILLMNLKVIFYHYFLLSLPFYAMVIARAFTSSKDQILRGFIILILILAIYSNFKTIDYYINPSNASRMIEIDNFVNKNSGKDDKIFGEPSLTNYISFISDRKISSDYLDSYMQHMVFEGTDKVVKNLEKDKPKFVIEVRLQDKNYYLEEPNLKSFILGNYKNVFNSSGIPEYLVFQLK